MKVTGSPTKRNSENAISPTVSMTRTAWARRRRTNASIFERMVPHVLRRRARRLAAAPWPSRPAVAGHARPVPGVALGSDVAADPGERRRALLRAFSQGISLRRGAGCGDGGGRAAHVERAGLLRARAQFASGGKR